MAGAPTELAVPDACRNCGAALHGTYCSACGESHRYGRLELRALVEDVLEGLTNLDTRVLRTIADLSVDPGQLGRDYLDGRRVAFIHPFKYAVASFALATLVSQALALLGKLPSDPETAQLSAFTLRWGQVINFAAMPVFATVLLALFGGRQRLAGLLGAGRPLNWVEVYVLVLYAVGHVALLQALLTPFLPYLGVVGVGLFAALPIVWVTWMLVGVAQTSWWSTILRVVAAFIVGMQLPAGLLVRWIAPELFAN